MATMSAESAAANQATLMRRFLTVCTARSASPAELIMVSAHRLLAWLPVCHRFSVEGGKRRLTVDEK